MRDKQKRKTNLMNERVTHSKPYPVNHHYVYIKVNKSLDINEEYHYEISVAFLDHNLYACWAREVSNKDLEIFKVKADQIPAQSEEVAVEKTVTKIKEVLEL
ncbi:hypothetical protein [Halobacillus massiliensis]|uniref:hypothetical protein n=1 Tax=Halobacillus massiliensis TaxID=1926286 RepID=UPI0009E5EFDC|nr:hypothetical protein [Halobacillus massiliensis]